MNWFCNQFTTYLHFWGWQDLIEVFFFITIFYKTTVWLTKDKTRRLIWYLYFYCTIVACAYFLHLSLIFNFLVTASPVAAIVIVLMHQEILQKRFATPVKIVPAQFSTQWIDELLQTCLIAMNSKKQMTFIIEYTDILQNFITSSYNLNTPCQKNILLLLIQSNLFNQHDLIWLSNTGIIKGINCTGKEPLNETENNHWQVATHLCTKTDALTFRTQPKNNSFDIVFHGNIIENISSTHCRTILLQYINKVNIDFKNYNSITINQKEKNHEDTHA